MERFKIGEFDPSIGFNENLSKFEVNFRLSPPMMEIQEKGGTLRKFQITNYLSLKIEKENDDPNYYLLVAETNITSGPVTAFSQAAPSSRNYWAFAQDNQNQELNFIGSDDIRVHLDSAARYIVHPDLIKYANYRGALITIPPNIPFQIKYQSGSKEQPNWFLTSS